jgi:uncharacterized membrane protein
LKQKTKKHSVRIYVAIIIGVIIIGLTVFYTYTADQAKIRGYTFGNNLQMIQDDLKKIQTEFETQISMLEEGSSTRDEFLEYSKKHFSDMEELVLRYDELSIPDSFVVSVNLFKLSTKTQLESDQHLVHWIETGDDAAKIRSDALFQESFEYEMAALASYNNAKGQTNP